jgi:hypothetical protein
MDVKAPNIFSYATKELSQDAFLCWLLAFADPKYRDTIFNNLHLLATDLLNAFLGENQIEIKKISIKTQQHKIDIWIEINSDILIIIEDKINSRAGVNQLSGYYQKAEKYITEGKFTIICAIYFKTGNEAERIFNRENIENKWRYFSLKDLINIMGQYTGKIDHPYFIDFYTINFNKFEANKYFERHISVNGLEETQNIIIEAFYKKLEDERVFTNWGYNDSKGVRTYYSNEYSYSHDNINIYLQLERLKLRYKVDLGKLGKERGKDYQKFQKNLREYDIKSIYNGIRSIFEKDELMASLIEKPSKLSVHNFLTFGVVPLSKWAAFSSDGILDYEATKSNIIKIKQAVEEFTNKHQKQLEEIIVSGFIKKI